MGNIPYGFCHCGCGIKTTVPNKTDKAAGRIKSQPMRYVRGHGQQGRRTENLTLKASEYRQWWQDNANVPYGYCWCGCGEKTKPASHTDKALGWVFREPTKFKRYHFAPHQRRLNEQHQYDIIDNGFTTPCWIWRYGKHDKGYATTMLDGKRVFVHRIYYERKYGPIPEGLEPDHLCRVRACINPDHLEAVTHTENVRRGHSTKLTYAKAQEMRARYARGGVTYRQLGRMYGVVNGTVRYIIRKEGWN